MSDTTLVRALATALAPHSAVSFGLMGNGNAHLIEQLNALGAGMIGRRIIELRPYASPDELLTRRVLKRADYETIKNAITAR